LRACVASILGHAAGLVSLALLSTEGSGEPAADHSALVATVSEAVAQLDVAQVIPTIELDPQTARLDATYASSYVNESNANLLGPSIGQPGLSTGSLRASASLGVGIESELEEKQVDARKPLGRTANFYGIEAEGSKFVFVVDMSGSMAGARFRRARSELRQAIEHLGPAQSFYVVLFNDAPNPMPAVSLASVIPANVELVSAWLRKIECRGGTNPLPALLMALAMKPDAVFLLSDGKFDPTTAQAVSQFESWQHVPIHTIGFASRKGEAMLRAISQVSGGTYRYVH
jgi:hypothetical protein